MVVQPAEQNRPHGALIGALLLAILALPLLGAFGVTEVGAYRMFSRPVDFRVRLMVFDAQGIPRDVPAATLNPHLTPSARRVLAIGSEHVGEAQATLVPGALEALARQTCSITGAHRVNARMDARPWFSGQSSRVELTVTCP